ncbi:unnamed protein product, partial [Symbiodinium sp. KB8]
EECRRIHKALEHKSLKSWFWFCPLQDMTFIHHNDGDVWERCCIQESFFTGDLSAKCEALSRKQVPVMEKEEPPDPVPVTKQEKIMAVVKLVARISKEIAKEVAAKYGFGGCPKSCKPDGIHQPPPLCLATPRQKAYCVYPGRSGDLFAFGSEIGEEAKYKVVQMALPAVPLAEPMFRAMETLRVRRAGSRQPKRELQAASSCFSEFF